MVELEKQDHGDSGLVFVAWNHHDPRCGRPTPVRTADNPGLYHGYFENRYGEQFVFTFDRAIGTGTVSGGDLGWGDPRSFTIGQIGEVLDETRGLAAQAAGHESDEASNVRTIDAAFALGRLT